MSAPKPELRRRVLALHGEGLSQHEIARRAGVSRARVQQILDDEVPDRMHRLLLERATIDELRRHECVLIERIRRDRRQLRATRDEISTREVDEVLGLTLSTRGRRATIPACTSRRPSRRTATSSAPS